VIRGAVSYRMFEHSLLLEEGSLALFWGGLPHQVIDVTADAEFVAIHLPLGAFLPAAAAGPSPAPHHAWRHAGDIRFRQQ